MAQVRVEATVTHSSELTARIAQTTLRGLSAIELSSRLRVGDDSSTVVIPPGEQAPCLITSALASHERTSFPRAH